MKKENINVLTIPSAVPASIPASTIRDWIFPIFVMIHKHTTVINVAAVPIDYFMYPVRI